MALNKNSQNVLSKLGKEALADIQNGDPDGRTEMIDVSLIDENPDNIEVFDMKDIDLLARDIEKYGFRGAIEVLDKKNGRYEVLSGHRRLRAVKQLGRDRIRCFIRQRDPSEKENDRLTVEELLLANMRNRDITPMQKSRAVKLYFDRVLDVYYPSETHEEKVGRACEFFGLKSAIIDRLLGFQTLNERFKDYIDLPGFPVHGLVGTKRMDDDEISVLIDTINKVPGFQDYKNGLEPCPLSTQQLKGIVRDITEEFSEKAPVDAADLYADPVSNETREIEDLSSLVGEKEIAVKKSGEVSSETDNNNQTAKSVIKEESSVDNKKDVLPSISSDNTVSKTVHKGTDTELSEPIASSSKLVDVDTDTIDLAEVTNVQREIETARPRISDIKARTTDYYYQMTGYLDSIPIETYNKEEQHALKIILDSMIASIKKISEQLK